MKISTAKQLFILGLFAFGLRLCFAIFTHGYLFVDEVPQYLNVAYYKAFGFGQLTWEWQQAQIRSWIVPNFFSYFISALSSIGMNDPLQWLYGIRIFLCAWSLLIVVSAFYIVKLLYPKNENAAFFAAALCGVWGYLIYFNLRTLGECLSMPAVMASIWWILQYEKTQNKIWALLAGMMIGLAFIIKFQAGVFILSSALYLLLRRQWVGFLFLNVGFLAMIGVQGISDVVEHGTFLRSPIAYFKYNVLFGELYHTPEGKLQRILDFLLKMHFPLLFPIILYFSFRYARKHLLLILSIVTYLGVHALIKNRQFRFFAPVLPIFLTAFSAGFMEWVSQIKMNMTKTQKYSLNAICLILIVAIGSQFASPAFPSVLRPQWNKGADVCLALRYVGQQPDSRGVLSITGQDPFYFYLGKNIPYMPNEKAEQAPNTPDYDRYNYLLFKTMSKKGESISLNHLHPQLIQDFKMTDPPVKRFGSVWMYKRVN